MIRFVVLGLVLAVVSPARADSTEYLLVDGSSVARAGTELRILESGSAGASIRIESPLPLPGDQMARTLLGVALGVATRWTLLALGTHGHLGLHAFGRFARPTWNPRGGRVEVVLGVHVDLRVLGRDLGVGLELAACPDSLGRWPSVGLVLHLPVLIPTGLS